MQLHLQLTISRRIVTGFKKWSFTPKNMTIYRILSRVFAWATRGCCSNKSKSLALQLDPAGLATVNPSGTLAGPRLQRSVLCSWMASFIFWNWKHTNIQRRGCQIVIRERPNAFNRFWSIKRLMPECPMVSRSSKGFLIFDRYYKKRTPKQFSKFGALCQALVKEKVKPNSLLYLSKRTWEGLKLAISSTVKVEIRKHSHVQTLAHWFILIKVYFEEHYIGMFHRCFAKLKRFLKRHNKHFNLSQNHEREMKLL